MRELRQLFRTYKFRSIVIRNFALLLSLSILSAGMFYFFTKNLFFEQYRENVKVSYMDVLRSTGNTLDAQLSGVAQAMRMSMNYEDIVRASLNPDVENFERNKNITNYLSSVLVQNHTLIDHALYYEWSDRVVYTSADAVFPLEEFADRRIIDVLDAPDASWSTITIGDTDTTVGLIDQTIYLYQDFPLQKRLGTMICVLDMEELYDATSNGGPFVGGEVYVYSESQTPVFPSRQQYPGIPPQVLERGIQDARDTGTISLADGNYYLYLGDTIQWVYLYPMNDSGIVVDNRRILEQFFPFLTLFLLISLIASVYSTIKLYLPVNRLMGSVRPMDKGMLAHRDEFDFLKHSVDHIVSQVDAYSTTIQMVTPAVLRNLFSGLIMGRQNDPDTIRETLESLRNPFCMQDKYLVLLTRIAAPDGSPLPEMESNLYEIKLKRLLEEETAQAKCYRSILFTDYRGDYVAILGFNEETSAALIKQACAQLRTRFEQVASESDARLFTGVGSICAGITELSVSYSEANQIIRTDQYRTTDAGLDAVEEPLELPQAFDNVELDYLKQRMRYVHRHLDNQDAEEAMRAMDAVLAEVVAAGTSEEVQRALRYIFDNLIEKTIPLHVSGDERIVLDKRVINEKLMGGNMEETTRFARSYCRDLLRLILTGTSKKQNRYVAAAKEFIAENYADSSLSVNSTSEHIGIHASYLGGLFRDHLGEYFTSYLNEYRVHIAMKLLTATNQSVTEIGFKTGFNSAQSFIRVFKKHVGMTPGQYREKEL